MKKRKMFSLYALVCLLILPAASYAIPISGSGQWGSFTGEMTFTGGNLNISLRNTSPVANGGYLVGFAFNVPEGLAFNGSYEYSAPPDSAFYLTYALNSINAAPYGTFDMLMATSGSFEGGGNPAAGLPVNSYASFSFEFRGDVSGVTVEDFLNTLSIPTGGGTEGASFVVRFRGFENDASDKVPYAVPEPGTMLLLGIGILGLGIASRRRS
ncbi:MAG: PEP-CTERM sorting domain-containing protein [Syntrophaceae bacterium]|nr:PEP-CTERM sorting domain-containing protein [Syntrophaceae bacterium]